MTDAATLNITQDRRTQITPAKVIRWAGLASLVAGVIFAGIQPLHPPDVVASVNTGAWAVITPLKSAMCLFLLLGITGIYARQVKETGWLGLVGYLMFALGWAVTFANVYAETFIMPSLAAVAPQFVDGFLGIAASRHSPLNYGAVPALFAGSGIFYTLGGLIFGIATFRAGVLPHWAGGLLATTAALTPLAALFPHAIQRLAAMPMGLALAVLGYALWSERRELNDPTAARN